MTIEELKDAIRDFVFENDTTTDPLLEDLVNDAENFFDAIEDYEQSIEEREEQVEESQKLAFWKKEV